MEEANFAIDNRNPLTELSDLRFELGAKDSAFELTCQLRLGKMQYEYKGNEYEIGVSRGNLRLTLEGCETVLGSALGESSIEPVLEEDKFEAQIEVGSDASINANLNTGVSAEVNLNAGASGKRTRNLTQNKMHFPVIARPNDSWEIRPVSVASGEKSLVDGTPIPNSRLAVLRRKKGVNRMTIIGELQISKSAIIVSAKGGNPLFRKMGAKRNKDAIVSLVLKRSIQREAASFYPNRTNSIVVFSRSEMMEQ